MTPAAVLQFQIGKHYADSKKSILQPQAAMLCMMHS
jgi:hypothetical protein